MYTNLTQQTESDLPAGLSQPALRALARGRHPKFETVEPVQRSGNPQPAWDWAKCARKTTARPGGEKSLIWTIREIISKLIVAEFLLLDG